MGNIAHIVVVIGAALFASSAASLPCPEPCYCFLKTVRCTHASLTRIPTEDMPPSIEVFDLRFNEIVKVGRNDLQNLTSLVTLFLSDNAISEIEEDSFSPLKELAYLYLYSNKLKTLPTRIFNGLQSLKQLYLQNNQLEMLEKDTFLGLSNLQRLYLQRNDLKTLSVETLSPLLALRRLRLESNTLDCNCTILQTVQFIFKKQFLHIAATCYHPEEIRGLLLTSLTINDVDCHAPEIVEWPPDMNIRAGDSFKLLCKADGNPQPHLTWWKDGQQMRTEAIARNVALLKVEAADQEHTGIYTCTAGNQFGETTKSMSVLILKTEGSPTFSITQKEVEAILSNTVVLLCRVVSYTKPSISWSRAGKPLPATGYKTLKSGDLEIASVRFADSGYFRCQAHNNFGIATRRIHVIVKAPPLFTEAPKDLKILESETASLPCRAGGYPLPAIAWQKDGARLPADGRHVVLSSGTLRILSSRLSDEGVYECLAINVIGVNVSKALLQVGRRVPPAITVRPEDTTVQSGNTIHFTCRADGAPEPVIFWIKDGVQISSGSRLTTNATAGTLEIRDIGNVDAGKWECAARNSVGFDSKRFDLHVIGSLGKSFDGDQFVRPSFEQAKNEVNSAILKTKQKLQNFQPNSPGDLLALFRFPSAEAIELARAAEIFEVALTIIQNQVDEGKVSVSNGTRRRQHFNAIVSPDHVNLLANLSGCTAHRHPVSCSDICFHQTFRSYDGSCNNLKHPMQGASLTPFSRLLSPIYDNGFNTPVGWNQTGDTTLPSPRLVSMELVSTANTSDDPTHTHMLMQWGQFVDHDLDFTVASPSSSTFENGLPCSKTCENNHPCFPIPLPTNDPRLKYHKCMEFTRSSAVCGSGRTSLFFGAIMQRQQINQITAYMDASNVYGSSEKDAKNLRDLTTDNGLLRTLDTTHGGSFMPYNKDTPIDCQVNKSHSRVPCFLAGDHRANEHLGLLSMHTLWVREHNRIAKELAKLNNKWNGERIYQEARKIVGAEMQHITFTGFLPKILGERGMALIGKYAGYDPAVDSSISNSFATAAYRFGHTLVQPILTRFDESLLPSKYGHLPLHKAFFSPYRLVEEGGIDPILRGFFASAAKSRLEVDQLVSSELTDHLFEMAHAIALDLAALNIQRGRDHGLPSYNSWRQFCNLTVAITVDDLKGEIPDAGIRKVLQELYGSPDRIDLWIGGILEKSLPGSRLGPLFACLIGLQFKKVRDGDRFWYENPATFSRNQLAQIQQASLAKVICENSDGIKAVQRDVFQRVDSAAEYLPCQSISGVDLRPWKHCGREDDCSNAASQESSENNVGSGFPRHTRSDGSPQDALQILNAKLNNVHSELKTLSSEMKELFIRQSPAKAAASILSELDCVDEELNVRKNDETWSSADRNSCVCNQGVVICH